MMKAPEGLLSTKDAGQYLKMSPRNVTLWVSKGHLMPKEVLKMDDKTDRVAHFFAKEDLDAALVKVRGEQGIQPDAPSTPRPKRAAGSVKLLTLKDVARHNNCSVTHAMEQLKQAGIRPTGRIGQALVYRPNEVKKVDFAKRKRVNGAARSAGTKTADPLGQLQSEFGPLRAAIQTVQEQLAGPVGGLVRQLVITKTNYSIE